MGLINKSLRLAFVPYKVAFRITSAVVKTVLPHGKKSSDASPTETASSTATAPAPTPPPTPTPSQSEPEPQPVNLAPEPERDPEAEAEAVMARDQPPERPSEPEEAEEELPVAGGLERAEELVPPPGQDPHHALNTPVGDPDPTEWPDPYDQRDDPRDPAEWMTYGEAPHTPTGARSTSEPHPREDIEAFPTRPSERHSGN